MRRALVLVGLLAVAPVAAQEPTPLRWTSHEAIPQRISDGLVAAQVALAIRDAWRAPDRKHAVGCLALENGVSLGATTLLKYAIHRTRPNGDDDHSFPSGHTAMATVNGTPGWRYGLTVGVGWGRQAGGKHYATDVLAGAGLGWLSSRICHDA
jgi:membrane-associated phospholipid phosphatase